MTYLLAAAIVALAVLAAVVFVSSVLAYAIAPLIWMAAAWALECFLEWRGK